MSQAGALGYCTCGRCPIHSQQITYNVPYTYTPTFTYNYDLPDSTIEKLAAAIAKAIREELKGEGKQ